MGRVLIVDDAEELSELCQLILTMAGHEVVTATNGRQGLEQVHATHPDVVLLDMMMPEMDGLEVLDMMHDGPPVIAYSGFDRYEEVALARGAAAFLRKPFAPSQLLGAVEATLAGARPSDELVEAQAAFADAAHAQEDTRRQRILDRIDLDHPELRSVLERLTCWLHDYFGVDRALVTALQQELHVVAACASDEVMSGMTVDPAQTYCPEVVRSSAPFVLHDSAAHPVYRPLADVRFYAGAPLVVGEDAAVGTLCLQHLRPFAFGAEDLALLIWFARRASERLAALADGRPITPILIEDRLLPLEAFLVVVDAQLRAVERDGGGVQLIVISAGDEMKRVLIRAIDRAAGRVGVAMAPLAGDRLAVAVRAPTADAAIGRSDLVLIAADAMLDGPRIGIAHWDPSAPLLYPAARFLALAETAHRQAAFHPARLHVAPDGHGAHHPA